MQEWVFKMKAVLDFFLDWKVKLSALIFACILAYSWHTVTVHNAVSVAKVQTQIEVAAIYNKRIDNLKKESDKAQFELKATLDTQLKDKDAQFKTLNTKYNNLANSLLNRPERPSSQYGLSIPSSNKASTPYVDGSKLYRSDGTFLIRLAARTEGLKIELQSCYKQYDLAKKTLDDFKEAHSKP